MILYNEYQIIPTLCQKVFQDNQKAYKLRKLTSLQSIAR